MGLNKGIWMVMLLLPLCCSCLKEGDSTYAVENVPAVVTDIESDTLTLRCASTPYGMLYGTAFSSFSKGKCLLISFTYLMADNGEKAVQERGYYSVDVAGSASVDQYASLPDVNTTTLLSNELPVAAPVYSGYADLFTCQQGFLFIPSVYLTTASQTAGWSLFYDVNGKAESTGQVYSFYLRANADAAPDSAATDTLLLALNAFNISDFLDRTGIDTAAFYARIHYVSSIASDSASFTWDETDPMLIKQQGGK